MEESTNVPDSQDVIRLAANLLDESGGATRPGTLHPTREFLFVPPSVAYQYAFNHSQMYGLPLPQHPVSHPGGPYAPMGNPSPQYNVQAPTQAFFNPVSSPIVTPVARREIPRPASQPRRASCARGPRAGNSRSSPAPSSTDPGPHAGNARSSPAPSSTDPGNSQGNASTDSDPMEEENAGQDTSSANGRSRWENWELRHLLEVKRAEYAEMDRSGSRDLIVNSTIKWQRIREKLASHGVRTTAKRCKAKWDCMLRDYRKIKDFTNKTGNPPYQTLSVDERREENMPASFEDEWIEILDSFMGSRPSIVPPSVANSSGLPDSGVDDGDNPAMPSGLNGKRKRGVGENTKFLVRGMTEGMKESMETLGGVMRECEHLRIEAEEKQATKLSENCDKICEVLRMLAFAVVRMD